MVCPACRSTWAVGDACPGCEVHRVGASRAATATPEPVPARAGLQDLVAPALFVGIARTLTLPPAFSAMMWRG
jgi:hypothetical protein